MNPLDIKIEDGVIVIRIGVDTLAWAACHGPHISFDINTNEFLEPKVTDATVFAKAVVAELGRETETGETPVSDMFDDVIVRAIENGAEGIQWPGDPV